MQRSVKLLYWLEETPRSGMPWSRPRPSSPRPAPSSSTSCSRITRVLTEKVPYYSEKHQEMREGLISANQLRSWLEECTVATNEHPHPFPDWDFKARFPGMPSHARRAAMKEAIGKARAYLTALATWHKQGKKKGKPGFPGAANHPTFYQGAFHLELAEAKLHDRFVRLKVYDAQQQAWMNYPAPCSRHFQARMAEQGWQPQNQT